jgi:hypothetical protein
MTCNFGPAPCGSGLCCWRFRGTYCLHHQGWSEGYSVSTQRCKHPKAGLTLTMIDCENLKSVKWHVTHINNTILLSLLNVLLNPAGNKQFTIQKHVVLERNLSPSNYLHKIHYSSVTFLEKYAKGRSAWDCCLVVTQFQIHCHPAQRCHD